MFKFIIFLSIFSLSVSAETMCDLPMEDLPTLAGGRIKPLHVLAQDSLRFMTGKSKPFEEASTATFCYLSFSQMGLTPANKIQIKVDHPEVRKLLQMKDTQLIDVDALMNSENDLRVRMIKIKENNAEKKEIQQVMTRMRIYNEITNGKTWTFATLEENKIKWLSLTDYISPERVNVMKSDDQGNPLWNAVINSKTVYDRTEGTRYLLELHYFKAHYFSWALVISLIALVVTFALQNFWWGISLTSLSLIIQIIGITIRVLISGRAPITNMYETVMFSGFGALVLSYLLTIFKKNKSFLLGGLTYNILCLMMMMMANNMLDSSIAPLVPVLRDNFWLSTHVTTVILSYAALALSWILANTALIRSRFFKNHYNARNEVQLIYTAIKFGVVLLAAGVILGGVWADYSWGRFWGWDPKETWSLIVLLVYIAILHGKYTQWIPPKRFIPMVAAAFMSVVMAWFGVNYILASGLHSYGFSEGGAIFIGSVFLAQTIILVLTYREQN